MVSKSKFLVVAAFAAFCISSSAVAQVYPEDIVRHSTNYFETGVKAGADFTQISAYPFTATYNTGVNAGVYIKRRINSFGLHLEATVSSAQFTTQYPVSHKYVPTRTKYEDTVTKGVFNALYVNIPLMLEIRPGNHFAFQFGAQYSYLLSLKDKNSAFASRYGTDQILNNSNISLVTGFELDVYKDLKIGARYAMGITDVNALRFSPLSDKWMINTGQVYLMYSVEKFRHRG